MTCSPLLGETCVSIILLRLISRLSVLLLVGRLLFRRIGELGSVTFILLVTVWVAPGRLLATTIRRTLVRWYRRMVLMILGWGGLLKVSRFSRCTLFVGLLLYRLMVSICSFCIVQLRRILLALVGIRGYLVTIVLGVFPYIAWLICCVESTCCIGLKGMNLILLPILGLVTLSCWSRVLTVVLTGLLRGSYRLLFLWTLLCDVTCVVIVRLLIVDCVLEGYLMWVIGLHFLLAMIVLFLGA